MPQVLIWPAYVLCIYLPPYLEINLNCLNFAVKQDYKSELDLLAESHRLALKALESEHENYLKGTVHK